MQQPGVAQPDSTPHLHGAAPATMGLGAGSGSNSHDDVGTAAPLLRPDHSYAGGDGAGDDSTTSRAEPAYPHTAVRLLLLVAVCQSYAQSCTQSTLAFFFKDGLEPAESYSDDESTAFVNAFIAAYSLAGVAGAWWADNRVGNYRAERISSWVWTLGAVVMMMSVIRPAMGVLGGAHRKALTLGSAFAGLFLTALGYGVINPLQSVFLADQFRPGQEASLSRSFSHYYLFCNVGNIMGEFLGPAMRYYLTYEITLATVSAMSAVGLALFIVGGRVWRKVPPAAKQRESLRVRDRLEGEGDGEAGIVAAGDSSMASYVATGDYSGGGDEPLPLESSARAGDTPAHDAPRRSLLSRFWQTCVDLRHVFRVFVPLPMFFALLYQQSSTWVFQGSNMSLHLVGKVNVPPDLMPSLDDVLCVILIPTMDFVVYPWLERRRGGRPLSILSRMTSGMVCVILGFVVCGLLQIKIDNAPKDSVSIVWQVPQYCLISLGEILVAVPGLEFAYSQAPRNTKGLVTALWACTQAAGALIVAAVANVDALNNAATDVFFAYAIVMGVFTAAFVCLTRGFEYKETAANVG